MIVHVYMYIYQCYVSKVLKYFVHAQPLYSVLVIWSEAILMSFMSKRTSVLNSEVTSLWNKVSRVGVLFIEVSSVQGVCSKQQQYYW